MFTKAELIDAINQLEDGKHSIQNCERLAAIYTVLDHLYGEEIDRGYSYDNRAEAESTIGNYGESQFLTMIADKPAVKIWHLIDELMDALQVLNPRLFNNFLDKINEL